MAIQEVLVSKIFNYTSEPTKKVEGQFWFNPTTNILSRYNGTDWKPITISSDDVVVLTDGNKVSLTNYLNTSIAVLAEGIDTKQDKLKAGDNISIGSDGVTVSVNGVVPEATKATQDGNGNEISVWYATTSDLESKQNKLTAGDNISIDNTANTIKVTGVVPNAQQAAFADQATSDGFGNNIAETYATIGDLQDKQDTSNLVTTITDASDDIHYPSAKAVYTYAHASITSTTEITITPSSAQTATSITNALAKKARVVVTPSLSNTGAIYIKESTTYSSLNPIYPDPTNNVYEFSNMQNVNVFADFAGDSVDLTIEYRG